MSIIMGLDFGTTNSAMALLENNDARVININNRESSEHTLRSVLFIGEEREIFVGQQAIDQYIELEGTYGRFLQSLKTFLPDSAFTETRIFGEMFTIEDLITLILKEIKRIGENSVGCIVDHVIIGRPVFFSEDPKNDALAESRMRTAAEYAGFKTIEFEYEPIAATLVYLNQLKSDSEQIVLMGDFGGGTSDFTVMKLKAGVVLSKEEKRERVLSVGGVYVGGYTFNSRIMWEKITPYFGRDVHYKSMTGQTLDMPVHFIRTLCEWHRIPFLRDRKTLQSIRDIRRVADKPNLVNNLENLILENKGFFIFQAIERAKRELSVEVNTEVSYHDRGLQINENISRLEFEKMIESDIAKILACVNKVIEDAEIRPEKVDKVLLTGGSSFVPIVRRVFEQMFGDDKIVSLDAFTSVAHGLALSGSSR